MKERKPARGLIVQLGEWMKVKEEGAMVTAKSSPMVRGNRSRGIGRVRVLLTGSTFSYFCSVRPSWPPPHSAAPSSQRRKPNFSLSRLLSILIPMVPKMICTSASKITSTKISQNWKKIPSFQVFLIRDEEGKRVHLLRG